jgi:MraZ protein
MLHLTGEFKVTLDEKGRISLPALLRRCLNESTLYLTEGYEKSLWLYPSNQYNEMINLIKNNTDPFSQKDRNLRRRFAGPFQEVEIDKAGRIPITVSLREFAELSKDCVVLGQIDYIEIWAEERYRSFKESGDEGYAAASEELSLTLKKQRSGSDK